MAKLFLVELLTDAVLVVLKQSPFLGYIFACSNVLKISGIRCSGAHVV